MNKSPSQTYSNDMYMDRYHSYIESVLLLLL